MEKFIRSVILGLLVMSYLGASAQLKRANKKFDRKEYAVAIPLYQRHLEKTPTSGEGMEKLAHCYRLINDSRNAEYWYSRLEKSGNKDPQNAFFYAQSLINNEKWDDAVPILERYLQDRDWDEVAQNMLVSAQTYRDFMLDSARYIVNSTNINTAKSEFSPMIYRNTLVFSSSRKPEKSVFNWTGDNFLDLYQAQYYGKSELGQAEMLPGLANSKYHEGGSSFSPDGNKMYFTRNAYNGGKLQKGENGLVRLKTFSADLVHNKWQNITEVPFNGAEYSVGHPCISPDGNSLYFVSDMPGGEGGTDVWVVHKQGDGWGSPENVGPRVNSPANEMFPWISSTGVFYFASNGHPGLGGLDLFRVTSMGSEFEKVSNMGYPVNSPKDDFALVIDEKSGIGFFSSNRKGGKGDDDIYSFTQRQILEGLVVDNKEGNPIENAKVEIYGVRGLATVVRTDDQGRFRYGLDRNTDYMLVGSAENYLEAKEKISTVSFDPSVPVDAVLRLPKDESAPIYALKGKVEGDSIDNLAGTTVRIRAKEVIVSVDEDGNFEYNLAPDTDYEVRIEKEGYMDKVMDVSTKGLDPGEMSLNAMLLRLMPDTALYKIYYDYADSDVRSDAYQELDRVVSYMKRNPTIKLRLVSHADARGGKSANDRLSRRRSSSAYTYLTKHGIKKNRLEQIWLGERKPANDCIDGKDCTEDEYQENRRTEIQYGGKMKQSELPQPEPVEEEVDDEEPVLEGKDAIKAEDAPSGKDLIKDTEEPSGKDAIKAAGEDAAEEETPAEEVPAEDVERKASDEVMPAEEVEEKGAEEEETPAEDVPAEEVERKASDEVMPAEEVEEKGAEEETPAEEVPAEEVERKASDEVIPAVEVEEKGAEEEKPAEEEMIEELIKEAPAPEKKDEMVQDFDTPPTVTDSVAPVEPEVKPETPAEESADGK